MWLKIEQLGLWQVLAFVSVYQSTIIFGYHLFEPPFWLPLFEPQPHEDTNAYGVDFGEGRGEFYAGRCLRMHHSGFCIERWESMLKLCEPLPSEPAWPKLGGIFVEGGWASEAPLNLGMFALPLRCG